MHLVQDTGGWFHGTMKRFLDQCFINMNAHAHLSQIKVVLFKSFLFLLMFFVVMQDGLPVLVD